VSEQHTAPTRRNAGWFGVFGFVVVLSIVAFLFLRRDGASAVEIDGTRAAGQARKLESKAASAELESPRTRASIPPHETAERRVEADSKFLVVTVVDPAGSIVAGARLAIFREAGVLHSATTDAKGGARFDSGTGSAEYAIAAPGWTLARGELELAAGERSLSLGDGEVISGVVVVDGAIPSELLRLKFTDQQVPATQTPVARLPAAVLAALEIAEDSPTAVAMTQSDGSFAFRGLLANASGWIRWDARFFVLDASGKARGMSVLVPAPRRDLVLRLTEGGLLRFRVVDSTLLPVPHAPVALTVGPMRMTTTADSEGRFSKAILEVPDGKIVVGVALVGGAGARTYDFVWPRGSRGIRDVGDLATEPARSISVLVQDQEGKPIAGAAVRAWPTEIVPEDRTDAEGRIRRNVGTNEREIAVTAFGYLPARVPVPSVDPELVVTLAKASILEFELAGNFEGTSELTLVLEGSKPLFVGQGGNGPEIEQISRLPSMTWNETSAVCESLADKHGHWTFIGLAPNQPLHATLNRPGSLNLYTADVSPLAAGEHRVVSITIEGGVKSLRVRVLGQDRAPLVKAVVFVGDPALDPGLLGYSTDAQGEAVLEPLFGDRVVLISGAEGYAPKSMVVHPIPSGTVEIRLEPPVSVEVELVSRDGKPLEEEQQVTARFAEQMAYKDSLVKARWLGSNRYRIERLPSAEILISAEGPAGSATLLHDARVPFARMEVGQGGTIHAKTTRPKDRPQSIWSLSVAQPGSSADLTRSAFSFDPWGSAETEIQGLAFGTYDAWLELRSDDDLSLWSRVGQPTKVVVDAEHPSANIELRP